MNFRIFLLKNPIAQAVFSHVAMRGTLEKQEFIEEGRESVS